MTVPGKGIAWSCWGDDDLPGRGVLCLERLRSVASEHHVLPLQENCLVPFPRDRRSVITLLARLYQEKYGRPGFSTGVGRYGDHGG